MVYDRVCIPEHSTPSIGEYNMRIVIPPSLCVLVRNTRLTIISSLLRSQLVRP